MREIEIVIDDDGTSQVDVKGVRGPTCAVLMKKLVDSLGSIRHEEKKSAYHQETSIHQDIESYHS